MENRNGLVAEGEVSMASGHAERDDGMWMVGRLPGQHGITLGADKGYDTKGFIAEVRRFRVNPHVAQSHAWRGGSAIDRRTTRHPGYALCQCCRKPIEMVFGWMKIVGSI